MITKKEVKTCSFLKEAFCIDGECSFLKTTNVEGKLSLLFELNDSKRGIFYITISQ